MGLRIGVIVAEGRAGRKGPVVGRGPASASGVDGAGLCGFGRLIAKPSRGRKGYVQESNKLVN